MESSENADHAVLGDLYTALCTLTYTMAGSRTHTRLRKDADVPVDRASLAVLRALAASPSPLRMGELAEVLMVQAPHVTREVRRLADQGLVTITPEPGDQRARRAEVTEDGRAAVARTVAAGKEWLADALKNLSAEELRTTATVLGRIVDSSRA